MMSKFLVLIAFAWAAVAMAAPSPAGEAAG